MNSTFPQYRIVSSSAPRRSWRNAALAMAWLMSLGLTAWGAHAWGSRAAIPGVETRAAAADASRPDGGAPELAVLRQRVAMLEQSERITRAANLDLQDTLSQRETQIAGLRSDVAFYARLVGPTAERKPLGPFSVRFTARGAEGFGYRIVLTQTLNRSAISSGTMQFTVEGVREGRREVLDWKQLHPGHPATAQAFSFRYFQELSGSVVLPPGFSPQRVRVSLLVPGQPPVQRDFDWTTKAG